MGRHRVEVRELRAEMPEQRVRVEAELGAHLMELGEGPAVGLLGLIAAAWSQLPPDVAAAACLPDRAELDRVSVHSGGRAGHAVRGASTSGSR